MAFTESKFSGSISSSATFTLNWVSTNMINSRMPVESSVPLLINDWSFLTTEASSENRKFLAMNCLISDTGIERLLRGVVPDELVFDDHRREDADKSHIVGETDCLTCGTLLNQFLDRHGREQAGLLQSFGRQLIPYIFSGLLPSEETGAVRRAIRLFGPGQDVRRKHRPKRFTQDRLLTKRAQLQPRG